MGNTIPYFYGDLIARMVPGTVLIALIRITTLHIPEPWTDFISNLGSAQTVIVPLLLAGLVYILGMVLEALLSIFLELFYIFAFSRAGKKYSRLYPRSDDVKKDNIRKAKHLSRASFGHLIASPSDYEKQVIPHIVRFHSEAKMCFSSIVILVAFLVLAIVDKNTNCQLIRNVENASLWLLIIILSIPILLYISYQRLQSRAWFIFRTFERSVAEKESESTKKLRDELLAFCDLQK